MLGGSEMFSGLVSLRAVLVGFCVLLLLYGGYALAWNWGWLEGWWSLYIAAFAPYAGGGFVAGLVAGRNQVLNASLVGVLFGLALWVSLRLSVPAGFEDAAAISDETASIGAAIIAVIVCGAGGLVSLLISILKRKSA